jgi:quinoprotein glucose dehydrogenase
MLDRLLLFLLLGAPGLLASAQNLEANDWPEFGGTLAGQRYSTARQIDTTTVSNLQIAWTFHTHALDKPSPHSNWRSSFEATPVLWNGTLYFDTPFNAIFALDAATGKLRWTFDPQIDRESPIYIVTSRGVSLWHAKSSPRSKQPRPGPCASDAVIMATLDRRLIARDAITGAPCPRFGNRGTVDLLQGVALGDKDLYGFTSPPTIVGDTIVLGSSVADSISTFAASGAVRGFDAVTGVQKWSWDPVRWTHDQHPPGSGSGNAWSVMSADPEHDLVFVPTGSASNDFYGGTRIGDNRDADSIVALQASTGRRVWAFQLVHHDLWDYDTPSQPVLFTFRHSIPALAVTTKTSMVYVFNRLTGEPLYPIEERKVPSSSLPGEQAWPTQPFSTLPSLTALSFTSPDLHLHNPASQKYCVALLAKFNNQGIFTPPSARGSLVYPGSVGGANWGSSAFDPSTATLYTRVSSVPYMVRQLPALHDGLLSAKSQARILKHLPEVLGGDPPPLKNDISTPDSGGVEALDPAPELGTPYRMVRQAIETPTGAPCAPTPFGSIVALNLDTGIKSWSVPHGQMVDGEPGSIGVGGVIVTAGGLVIGASTNDAFLRAYDSATGKELWRGALPVSANATPMTYTIQGRQYLVIAAGGHGFLAKGKSDQVIAFALPSPAPPAPAKHR